MDKLYEILGEELSAQVKAKLGDKKFFVGEGEFIPKSRFDEINNQLKDVKSQVADRDKQIASLSENAKGNEDLKAKIEELTVANKKSTEEYESKLAKQERDYLINDVLKGSKAKNIKALTGMLDMEKVTIKDGKVEGLNEQIEELKKTDSYLFNIEEPQTQKKAGLSPQNFSKAQAVDPPQPGSAKRWNAHKNQGLGL